ncbi:MAG: hypothetical protein R3C29_09705 [Dehalococcoidia bacterium]
MRMPLRLVPAASEFVAEPWRPAVWVQVIALSGLLGLAGGLFLVAVWNPGRFGEYRYSLTRWELDNLVGTVFTVLDVGPNPTGEEADLALQRYFALTTRIRAEEESPAPDLALIDTLVNERATYENDVERLVEGYVDEAVAKAGLRESLPLFDAIKVTWPPVDFELVGPPRLLITSPRDRILRSDLLLRSDLSLAEVEAIETEAANDETSSLIVSIGGIATYPAIVRDNRSYDSLLDTAAHEWVHHYLAFYPLGRTWGSGGDSEPLNETTANIAGRALAEMIRAAHPVEFPDEMDGRGPPGPEVTVDFREVMQQLRLDVDALLEDGKVEEAEALMEERRRYLEANGIFIRKINQAYFAFYGTYADSPASSNPIGPKIEELWDLTGDLQVFLTLMRDVQNADDLDEVLGRVKALSAELGAGE